MTWFRVDDQFGTHHKAMLAGNAACGLWVRAGSWSAAQLTDGHIPPEALALLGGRLTDARKLVAAGLWHDHGHDCDECPQPPVKAFVFHGWEGFQPTRESVEAKRAVRREAGRKGGVASGRTRRGEAGTKQTVKQIASGSVEPPARPGPTHAAAAASERGGGGLPADLDVLRSRMSRFTALSALRWDILTDEQTATVQQLIATHGDQRLVDVAVQTCRTPPPVSVTAFIGTWRAIGGPRAVPDTEPVCAICNQPRRACERATARLDPDDQHPFQEAS